jgi:hypothetical protein
LRANIPLRYLTTSVNPPLTIAALGNCTAQVFCYGLFNGKRLPPRLLGDTTMGYDFSVPNAAPGVCAKCNGSGVFKFGGAVVNGVFTGKTGTCYSCGGTGHQTKKDIGRNNAYNRYKLACIGA